VLYVKLAAAAVLAAASLTTVAPVSSETESPTTSKVIEVKLVDVSPTEFAFSPAKITVRAGDVVRFTQTKVNAHNVEFKTLPAGVDLGDARVGPYLMAVEQVYEVKIDARFKPGTYGYVCTPHELMGMKGEIVVTP
jgi:plastocyanin